jgi:glycine C-acetyltransferase
VPIKSARLRIQLNAGHRRADIDHLVDVLRRHQHLAAPKAGIDKIRDRIK